MGFGSTSPSPIWSCRSLLLISGAPGEASADDTQFDCILPFYMVKKENHMAHAMLQWFCLWYKQTSLRPTPAKQHGMLDDSYYQTWSKETPIMILIKEIMKRATASWWGMPLSSSSTATECRKRFQASEYALDLPSAKENTAGMDPLCL